MTGGKIADQFIKEGYINISRILRFWTKKNYTKSKWKRILIAMVSGLVFLIGHSDAFALEPVRIAVHDYPPYYDADGRGLLSDVYRAAFKAVGMEVDILVYPIIRGKRYLYNQKVDAYSPHLFFSEAEMEQITWTPAANISVCLFFYLPKQPRIPFTSLEDLRGYSMGTVTESIYIPVYKKHGMTVETAKTPFQLLKKTRAGRHSFFETTVLTGLLLVKTEVPEEWQHFDYYLWNVQEVGLTFLKDAQRSRYVKRQFDKGLAIIKKNGEYINILENYWGKGNIPKYGLIKDMSAFGTSNFNPELFYTPRRTSYGKILN